MRALTDWFGKPLPNPPTSGKDKGQAPVKQVGLNCKLVLFTNDLCYIGNGIGFVIGRTVKCCKCPYFLSWFAWYMLIEKNVILNVQV